MAHLRSFSLITVYNILFENRRRDEKRTLFCTIILPMMRSISDLFLLLFTRTAVRLTKFPNRIISYIFSVWIANTRRLVLATRIFYFGSLRFCHHCGSSDHILSHKRGHILTLFTSHILWNVCDFLFTRKP